MVAVEKPLLRVLSVSSYLTRIAHAPYYIGICNLSGCSDTFTHYLINETIFGNALPNIKCVFYLSLQLASERFLILRRIYRDMIINVHASILRVSVGLVI